MDKKIFVARSSTENTSHINNFITAVVADCTETRESFCYFGIIACACKFESALSEVVDSWFMLESQNDNNKLISRIMDKVAVDVSKTTGLDAWKSWIKTIFDINIADVTQNNWQDLTYLFKLRNKLAHGRATKFSHFYDETGKYIGGSTKGSPYEDSLNYLIDKRVISVDEHSYPSLNLFLTPKVVEYFADAVSASIKLLSEHRLLSGLLFHELKPGVASGNDNSEDHPLDLIEKVFDPNDECSDE